MRSVLYVLAVACVSLAAVSRPPALAATSAAVGLVFFYWGMRSEPDASQMEPHQWAAIAVAVILLFRFGVSVGPLSQAEMTARPWWVGLLAVSVIAGFMLGNIRMGRVIAIGSGVCAVLLVTGAMSLAEWRSDSGFDVYHMHLEAGDALLEGENPYTDAVKVANGSPFAPEGAVIEGYPYPPVVLGTYGLAGALSDPRVISATGFLMILGWLAREALRPGIRGSVGFAIFLLIAGLAVWPIVWFASWTEPLSAVLLLLSFLAWEKRPAGSAALLGLALASKQYFVFLVPLLLLHRGDDHKSRAFTAMGVAAATLAAGAVVNPLAFYNALIGNLAEIGFRPDTQSISGLLADLGVQFSLSAPVWILGGMLLSSLVAIGSRTRTDFVERAAVTLAGVFLIGQAFPNYWFLVLVLMGVAAVTSAATSENQSLNLPERNIAAA